MRYIRYMKYIAYVKDRQYNACVSPAVYIAIKYSEYMRHRQYSWYVCMYRQLYCL